MILSPRKTTWLWWLIAPVMLVVGLLLVFLLGVLYEQQQQKAVSKNTALEATSKTANNLIVVTSPVKDAVVASPLVITGSARGPWYFEASFPVRLLGSDGSVLGSGVAQAEGDWMTENFVPFTAILTFIPPQTGTGVLVLQKDNPSGIPGHDDALYIPVRFTPFSQK
ncbi:MAG: Gmad2 immunoglobulin-like domain-containing protein [Patescibacteria group bacterium]|jgi:hypothetical protein